MSTTTTTTSASLSDAFEGYINDTSAGVAPDQLRALQNTNMAPKLLQHGVTVVPVYDHSQLQRIRQQMIQDINTFPEYRHDGGPITNEVCTLGGFAAFGNPSQFHCTAARQIRRDIHKLAWDMITDSVPGRRDDNFEQIPDRVLLRHSSQKPTKEAWHRDTSPDAFDDDIVYGGWVNLDMPGHGDQTFRCILGTAEQRANGGRGFSALKYSKNQLAKAAELLTVVQIPPGHMVLFNSTIVHEVANAGNKTILRQFVGFRLSRHRDGTLVDRIMRTKPKGPKRRKADHGNTQSRIDQIIDKGALFPLKSGQDVPCVPAIYASIQPHRLLEGSRLFVEGVCEYGWLFENARNREPGDTSYRSVVPKLLQLDAKLYRFWSSINEDCVEISTSPVQWNVQNDSNMLTFDGSDKRYNLGTKCLVPDNPPDQANQANQAEVETVHDTMDENGKRVVRWTKGKYTYHIEVNATANDCRLVCIYKDEQVFATYGTDGTVSLSNGAFYDHEQFVTKQAFVRFMDMLQKVYNVKTYQCNLECSLVPRIMKSLEYYGFVVPLYSSLDRLLLHQHTCEEYERALQPTTTTSTTLAMSTNLFATSLAL